MGGRDGGRDGGRTDKAGGRAPFSHVSNKASNNTPMGPTTNNAANRKSSKTGNDINWNETGAGVSQHSVGPPTPIKATTAAATTPEAAELEVTGVMCVRGAGGSYIVAAGWSQSVTFYEDDATKVTMPVRRGWGSCGCWQ